MRTLANFQSFLSRSGNYQFPNRFKKAEGLWSSMVLAQTETEHADNVSHEVVERIAEAEDVDPLELTPPLCEVIDTDALESLFANSRASGKIVFNYKCYEVSIFSNGHISVEFYGT